MEKEFLFGPIHHVTKESSKRATFMDRSLTNGKTAEFTQDNIIIM